MDQGGVQVDKQRKTGRGHHSKQRVPTPRPAVDPGIDIVDVESEQSFPASDPPSHTPVTRDGEPMK
jgi:hypothetical protein